MRLKIIALATAVLGSAVLAQESSREAALDGIDAVLAELAEIVQLGLDTVDPAAREALVPGEDLGSGEAVLRRAPGHHGRHPGPLLEDDGADPHRLEPAGGRRLAGRGPAGVRQAVLDALGWLPHGAGIVAFRRRTPGGPGSREVP